MKNLSTLLISHSNEAVEQATHIGHENNVVIITFRGEIPANVSCMITDETGLSVIHQNLSGNSNYVDVSALKQGLYLVNISDYERTYSKKIYIR